MNKIWLGVLLSGVLAVPAYAARSAAKQTTPQTADQSRNHNGNTAAASDKSELNDALEEVKDARNVVMKMKTDPDVVNLLDRSRGVFIVPDYGRGAVVVGGSGGQGVLLAQQNGSWSGPAFYNVGSISLGLQAGATAGQIAMILMTDKAVNSFKGNNTFSLDSKAGITIANYSARGKASIGTSDVVLWSDTEGGFVGASVGATAISADEDANLAYYETSSVTPAAILNGKVVKSRPDAAALKKALPSA